jgi:hypothetical protein
VLTVIGGLFILGGGLIFAIVGAVLALFGFWSGLFLLGIVVGFLTLIVGVLMIVVPSAHSLWGILAIVFALVSIPVAIGGFVIGFLLTFIGGILALTWKPPTPTVITVTAQVVPPPPS